MLLLQYKYALNIPVSDSSLVIRHGVGKCIVKVCVEVGLVIAFLMVRRLVLTELLC